MSFSFGSNPVYVDEGQTIRLRFKAPSAWNTTQTVTVQIGEQTTLWYIVTIPEDFAPDRRARRECGQALPRPRGMVGHQTKTER